MCRVKDGSAGLAHSITRASSRQTYLTALLMVDKDLVDDFCRAYAYFRWVDDIIDDSSLSNEECISFINRQEELIGLLYRNEQTIDLTLEEKMIADLISHDRGENDGLQSFVHNMLSIIEFDVHRKGRLVSQQELTWYSECVGRAVTNGIQYFVGHHNQYPITDNRYLAGVAAHITHLLRDMVSDMGEGFINIPREYLEAHSIAPGDFTNAAFQSWVQKKVALARQYFSEGKRYIDGLNVLRCKVVGYWYCNRFEGVLDTIERDGYILQSGRYNHGRFALIEIAWVGFSVVFRHIARNTVKIFS